MLNLELEKIISFDERWGGGGVARFKKKLLNINRYRQIHSSKDRIALRTWIMVDSSQTYTVKKGPKHG